MLSIICWSFFLCFLLGNVSALEIIWETIQCKIHSHSIIPASTQTHRMEIARFSRHDKMDEILSRIKCGVLNNEHVQYNPKLSGRGSINYSYLRRLHKHLDYAWRSEGMTLKSLYSYIFIYALCIYIILIWMKCRNQHIE